MELAQRLPEFYRQMHSEGKFLGESWRLVSDEFHAFLDRAGIWTSADPVTILDFGCGPRGGLLEDARLQERRAIVKPHDPYVLQFSDDPWRVEPQVFFSCDVLEHLPQDAVHALLLKITLCRSLRHLFISISTRAANKLLPNGINAHLTVRPGVWWQGYLDAHFGRRFNCLSATEAHHHGSITFQFSQRK